MEFSGNFMEFSRNFMKTFFYVPFTLINFFRLILDDSCICRMIDAAYSLLLCPIRSQLGLKQNVEYTYHRLQGCTSFSAIREASDEVEIKFVWSV